MTYTIKRGDTLSRIAKRHGITFVALLAANPRYKVNPDAIRIGDKIEIPEKKPTPPAPAPADDPFVVSRGQLTFDAEGLEKRGRFFSRRLHVPGPWSGATIGRGYDMKERSRDEIVADLTAAGVSQAVARKMARTNGLKGKQAREFISENDLGTLEITPQQQKKLFLLTYDELEADVVRICNKSDVIDKYGATKWTTLQAKIRDVLVDLRYRGDYTGSSRQKVQPPVVRNNLVSFRRIISDEDYWGGRGVPADRFRRRRDYLRV